jgi:hypothetical protein
LTLIGPFQVQHLKFFRIFWEYNIFIIALTAIAGLTAIGLLAKPFDRAQLISTELERIEEERDREKKASRCSCCG